MGIRRAPRASAGLFVLLMGFGLGIVSQLAEVAAFRSGSGAIREGRLYNFMLH